MANYEGIDHSIDVHLAQQEQQKPKPKPKPEPPDDFTIPPTSPERTDPIEEELDPGLDVGRVTPPDRPPTPRVDQDEVG